jgi:hypothetical protein
VKRPSRRFAVLEKLAPLAVALPLMAASADDCTIAIRLDDGDAGDDIDVDDLDPADDADRDGLSNAEELERGLDPLNPDTDGDGIIDSVDDFDGGGDPGIGQPCNASFDCDAGLICVEGACLYVDGLDSDGDGLSDVDEHFFGTDPLNPDTDGDGIIDSNDPDHVGVGSDADGDGLLDSDEEFLGTDPLNPDTDGDGIIDSEDEDSFSPEGRPDRDGDGLPDTWEEAIGTNPELADTDGDGLSDFDEVYNFGTDPLNPDSNGDGVNDGNDPSSETDSDNDGLTDFIEAHFGTDPLNPDTDGDGRSDGDEVLVDGTDPLHEDH